MIKPLFKRNMSSAFVPFAIILSLISMYTIVIIYMYKPELSDMLNDFQKALPSMMSLFGMTGIATGLLDWIQIYLYGFIMLFFPILFTVLLVNDLVAGYTDDGSIACLLATPNKRRKIIATQAVSAILYTFLLMAAITCIGLVSCSILFPGELDIGRYLLLQAGTLLLVNALCGISFMAACFTNDRKKYYVVGAGIPVLFFFINMMSTIGDDLSFLKYATIYSLLDTGALIKGEVNAVGFAALALIAAATYAVGCAHFVRKDFSV